jgi:hypothetical protein
MYRDVFVCWEPLLQSKPAKEACDKVAALESVHEAAGGGYIPAHR